MGQQQARHGSRDRVKTKGTVAILTTLRLAVAAQASPARAACAACCLPRPMPCPPTRPCAVQVLGPLGADVSASIHLEPGGHASSAWHTQPRHRSRQAACAGRHPRLQSPGMAVQAAVLVGRPPPPAPSRALHPPLRYPPSLHPALLHPALLHPPRSIPPRSRPRRRQLPQPHPQPGGQGSRGGHPQGRARLGGRPWHHAGHRCGPLGGGGPRRHRCVCVPVPGLGGGRGARRTCGASPP